MSRHAELTTDWADGTYTFRLGLDELEELEAKFDKSIFAIVDDLRERRARSTEIFHVIRIGLVGGGMKPVDALARVRRYVDSRDLNENCDVAYAIALQGLARVHGSELERISEGEGVAATSDVSTSPQSTEALS